jgi:hypothetical protein
VFVPFRVEGQFVEGTLHGHAKMTYTTGELYEGQWLNGAKHGKGTFTWPAGHTWTGMWSDNIQTYDPVPAT